MSKKAKVSVSIALILLLVSPGFGGWLQSSMILHVLVQIPLLVLLGWVLGESLPAEVKHFLNRWNYQGWSGVLLMSGTGLFWMLPSALDVSVDNFGYLLGKVFSMVVLIGITLSITKDVWHPVLKGVFLLEAWAMLGRFGYGYIVSPDRLCANYLMGEQQILGEAMLWIAAVWALCWSLKILLGADFFALDR